MYVKCTAVRFALHVLCGDRHAWVKGTSPRLFDRMMNLCDPRRWQSVTSRWAADSLTDPSVRSSGCFSVIVSPFAKCANSHSAALQCCKSSVDPSV
jgi:hypothetical protein